MYKTKWNTGFIPTLKSYSYSKILTLVALIIPLVTIGAVLIQMGYIVLVYFKIISGIVFFKLADVYGIPFVFSVIMDTARSFIRNVAGIDYEMNGFASDVIKL